MNRVLRKGASLAAAGLTGALLAALLAFVVYLESRPDLDTWHEVELDQEFTEGNGVASFDEYLALEDRLFRQLDEQVYGVTGTVGNDITNRYKRGSLADPQRWPDNWNRSFEIGAQDARLSVLLLHGMSDSPYSLRHLGTRLAASGAHVLGLRIPGHGTVPSGLVTASMDDMAAAVRLAMQHISGKHPGAPIYILGYSNGAALGLNYALESMDDPALPAVTGLVQISPAIGVTPIAALAVWQARLGWLLGLEKLAWNDIAPEYDPFKYGSFAVNAGDVTHRLTKKIQSAINSLSASGQLGTMPPVLTFMSVVDATVRATAVVEKQFNHLAPGLHELILFDINRQLGIEPLLSWNPERMVASLREQPDKAFTLSLITNRATGNNEVVERRWQPGENEIAVTPLGLAWPNGVYSLSHVALPFPVHDPLYGGDPSEPSPGVHLGDIAMHGERDVLKIPPAAMLRLRWNPFYPYLEKRILQFMGLSDDRLTDAE